MIKCRGFFFILSCFLVSRLWAVETSASSPRIAQPGPELLKDNVFDMGVDAWTLHTTGRFVVDSGVQGVRQTNYTSFVLEVQSTSKNVIEQKVTLERESLAWLPFILSAKAEVPVSGALFVEISWQTGKLVWTLPGKGKGYLNYTCGEKTGAEGEFFTLPGNAVSPLIVRFGGTAGVKIDTVSLAQFYGLTISALYMKITVLEGTSQPVAFTLDSVRRSASKGFIGNGEGSGKLPFVLEERNRFKPGDSSPWMNVFQVCPLLSPSESNLCTLTACTSITYRKGGGYDYQYPERLAVKVEFSLDPEGKEPVKEISYAGGSHSVQFAVSDQPTKIKLTCGLPDRHGIVGVMSIREQAERILSAVKDKPYPLAQPKLFQIFLSSAPFAHSVPPYVEPNEAMLGLLKVLGGNGFVPGYADQGFIYNETSEKGLVGVYGGHYKVVDGKLVSATSRDAGSNVFRRCKYFTIHEMNKPETTVRFKEFLARLNAPLSSYTRYWLGDENVGGPIDHMFDCPLCTAAFREFLRERHKNVTPVHLGFRDWDEVHTAVPDRPERSLKSDRQLLVRATWNDVRRENPKLWYYTNLFVDNSVEELSRVARDVMDKAGCPETMKAGVSHSDFWVDWDLGMQNINYFNLPRHGRHTLMPVGTWLAEGATKEVSGLVCDVMRAGADRGKDCVVGLDLVVKEPLVERMTIYQGLCRNIKTILYWDENTWHGGQPAPERYYELGRINNEIGGVENLLYGMRRRRADVAFIWSKTCDTWGRITGITSERQGVHLAINHEQFNVDVLCEDDIEEGMLGNYKVAYLVGPNLRSRTAEKIREWVRAGGVLCGILQAGRYNEFNDRTNMLDDVFGLSFKGVETLVAPRESMGMRFVRPAPETITINENSVFADRLKRATNVGVLQKEKLTLEKGTEVLAVFADKTAAFTCRQNGKGKAFYIAFLPGAEYLHKALCRSWGPQPDGTPPPDVGGRLPFWYPEGERAIINLAAQAAGADRPVALDTSQIETGLMESDKGAIAFLMNFRIFPIEKVTVTLNYRQPFKTIRSWEKGTVDYTQLANGGIELSLPLATTDMIIIER